MTDPDILSAMITRTEQAYRLKPGAITGKGRTALEVAARFELVNEAHRAGYSMAYIAQFIGRDRSTISHAIKTVRTAA